MAVAAVAGAVGIAGIAAVVLGVVAVTSQGSVSLAMVNALTADGVNLMIIAGGTAAGLGVLGFVASLCCAQPSAAAEPRDPVVDAAEEEEEVAHVPEGSGQPSGTAGSVPAERPIEQRDQAGAPEASGQTAGATGGSNQADDAARSVPVGGTAERTGQADGTAGEDQVADTAEVEKIIKRELLQRDKIYRDGLVGPEVLLEDFERLVRSSIVELEARVRSDFESKNDSKPPAFVNISLDPPTELQETSESVPVPTPKLETPTRKQVVGSGRRSPLDKEIDRIIEKAGMSDENRAGESSEHRALLSKGKESSSPTSDGKSTAETEKDQNRKKPNAVVSFFRRAVSMAKEFVTNE